MQRSPPAIAVGLKFQDAQRRRAQRPRVKVTDDGQTIRQVVERLVRKLERREENIKELWPHFYEELERLELEPEELECSDLRKCCYEYQFGDKRRKISYGQFSAQGLAAPRRLD